jgi:hypothetical protein
VSDGPATVIARDLKGLTRRDTADYGLPGPIASLSEASAAVE